MSDLRQAEVNRREDLPHFVKTILIVIKEVGFPMAVAIYFFIKDWFFTERIIHLMQRVAVALDTISVNLK